MPTINISDISNMKINGEWICPYCYKCFKNRKNNLKTHLEFLRYCKIDDADNRANGVKQTFKNGRKPCVDTTAVNMKILNERIKNLDSKKKVKVKKLRVAQIKSEIKNFSDVEITIKYLPKPINEYICLECLILDMIKSIYTSDTRWKDNCIATYGSYWKMKWNNDWLIKTPVMNRKSKDWPKLTRSYFTRYIFYTMLKYLFENFKSLLDGLINMTVPYNREFWDRYKTKKNSATLEHQHKLHRMFVKKQYKKKKKNLETEIIDYSSESSTDIEVDSPTQDICNPDDYSNVEEWANDYNKIILEQSFKKQLQRMLDCIENKDMDSLKWEYDKLIDKHKEPAISKLPECEMKYKLIEYFENESFDL
jgi:hypothetical protein